MLKISTNNYLSVMKHRAKLISMFELGTKIDFFGLSVLQKENLFFTLFKDEEDFKKAYFSFIKIPCLMFWGKCIERLSDYDNKKSYELLNVIYKDKTIEVSSIFNDKKIDLYDLSFFKELREASIDTALFHNFYLNGKNYNSNSLLVLLDGYNLFFLKRKNFFCLCGLQL